MNAPYSGFLPRLKRYLHATFGEEWCEERDVVNRSLLSLLDDPEIRPGLGPWIKGVMKEFARAVDKATTERQMLNAERDDGKDYWGKAIPLVEPTDMRPLTDAKPIKGFVLALHATAAWACGLKHAATDGQPAEYYPSFLTLSGVPGCGKTMLAKAACYRLWGKNPVLFITEAGMMKLVHEAIQGNRVDAVMEELCGMPNLILDDFGSAALGPWDAAKRDEIISYRWENHESCRTMITTNLLANQIRDQSPRIHDRIINDKRRAVQVQITAPSYRGTKEE